LYVFDLFILPAQYITHACSHGVLVVLSYLP
jgi:hypothetical protein